MFNKQFIKTAQQLQHTDQKEVVKVAGLVRMLKNLWKSITNQEYKDSISKVQNNSKETQRMAAEVTKRVTELSSAIKDGDLGDYRRALTKSKKAIENFNIAIQQLELKTNVLFNYTAKEMKAPGYLDSVSGGVPAGYDVKINKTYKNTPLRSFDWYKKRNYDLFVGTNPDEAAATQVLISKTLDVLSSYYDNEAEYRSKFFVGENLKGFITAFIQAVFGGYLIKARQVDRGREITVKTLPFEIPGAPGATIIATVDLLDEIVSSSRRNVRMSLRLTRNVELSSNPVDMGRLSPPEQVEASVTSSIIKLAVEVPKTSTDLGDVEFASVLRDGHKAAFGGADPTAEVLAGAWAQVVLESGRPVKLPNNNIGNIKATESWVNSGQPFFTNDTVEFTPEGKKFIHHKAKWRAYASPVEGAVGYWKLIGGRYKQAMNWMAAGDPESASVALGMKTYFTASIKQYAGSVGKLYEQFMTKVAPNLSGLESSPAEAPGPKPELKQWAGQYSKEEKFAVLNPGQVPTDESGDTAIATNTIEESDQVDELMGRIAPGMPLAANSLTTLVKKSLLKAIPDSQAVVTINSDGSIVDKIEYARIVSSLARKYLFAKTDVCKNGNIVEIHCITKASENKFEGALQEVCDKVAEQMLVATDTGIYPVVLMGFDSEYPKLDVDELLTNRRKFTMQRFSNG